jgi:hypothetical protein
MRCVRFPQMDGMRKMKDRQRGHKSIEIIGSSTMFFFVTSHQKLFCIFHLHQLLQKVRERLPQKCLIDLIVDFWIWWCAICTECMQPSLLGRCPGQESISWELGPAGSATFRNLSEPEF